MKLPRRHLPVCQAQRGSRLGEPAGIQTAPNEDSQSAAAASPISTSSYGYTLTRPDRGRHTASTQASATAANGGSSREDEGAKGAVERWSWRVAPERVT